MAFWGTEIKPGKPYVHRFDEEKGRLHVSQATLGTFSSKKRTVVQCTVGEKTPIYICTLSAEPKDTCLLDLEFEEEDDVTFSVIGADSVHLSGYFYGQSQDTCGHDHGSDDSGEDIMGTESGSDESTDYDTDDSMDEFIDPDMDVFPPSPVPNSGVRIEEIIEDEKPVNESDASKRPKKKKSKLGTSGDSDIPQKQIVVKGGNSFPVMESEDEDGFPISSPGKKETAGLNTEEESKIKEKKADEEETKEKGKDNDASVKSVKRKIHAIAGDGDHLREAGRPDDSSAVSADCEVNDKQERKNKKKRKDKENKVQESGKGSNVGVLPDEATTTHVDQVLAVEKKNEVLTSKREKKKNKKIKKQESEVDGNAIQTPSDKNLSNAKTDGNAEAKPQQERTFPNGLVIQELGMGKPDGRKASPGKKVSVHYIGKLKKNGKIFDSNIGRAPFKFRLGIGQVIKGWDVGVNGMRVGDKRRLTIPPSMGYGSKGAGGDIPPNSWLVFDVELVDVS